ncbi:Peroxidase 45 [Orobanche hederae]
MRLKNQTTTISLLLLFILFLLTQSQSTQLRIDFYNNSCPNVEALVGEAVRIKFWETYVMAPATLRLFFHDCFVRGCDASIMLASRNGQAEKEHPDNLSLAGDGFDTVIKAKAAVDSNSQCRNRVSCADILALAARDVVHLTGGPFYPVELGRRDGRFSTKASVQRRLPGPGFNLDQLSTMFATNGLSMTDLVALSGAHTLGASHCKRFSNRIYDSTYGNKTDQTLNPQYAEQLRQECPVNVDTINMAVNMDPTTPYTFDNAYFINLQAGRGLFSSDQVLFTDNRTRDTVNRFASSNAAFGRAFAQTMTRLGRIGVLTGNQGEIRIDCTKVN